MNLFIETWSLDGRLVYTTTYYNLSFLNDSNDLVIYSIRFSCTYENINDDLNFPVWKSYKDIIGIVDRNFFCMIWSDYCFCVTDASKITLF